MHVECIARPVMLADPLRLRGKCTHFRVLQTGESQMTKTKNENQNQCRCNEGQRCTRTGGCACKQCACGKQCGK